MDFIKTSSLRALIELTFQRNWNGLIWMSRKGVITKRVKTVQTALSREQRPTAQSGWPRNECSALGQIIRPTEVSAKVQNHSADHASRPGKQARGRPRHNATPPRTTKAREPGNLAAAQPFAYHGRCIRPSRETSRVRPKISSAKSIRPTTPTDRESVRPRPFRLGHDPMSGRSSRRPSQRRGRPEALFEAQTYVFKPGLTLSRL
ncbi:unnamed protein product [Microthlaspi erraticum]|uniref:Uncharacterized protein n=1 Tax=Microthlaspi erraticum TaxID=1685480 RepID=A0A6D2J5S1_9BRAS|nr:unnamed protein product [Microthlaspi erraticum]